MYTNLCRTHPFARPGLFIYHEGDFEAQFLISSNASVRTRPNQFRFLAFFSEMVMVAVYYDGKFAAYKNCHHMYTRKVVLTVEIRISRVFHTPYGDNKCTYLFIQSFHKFTDCYKICAHSLPNVLSP